MKVRCITSFIRRRPRLQAYSHRAAFTPGPLVMHFCAFFDGTLALQKCSKMRFCWLQICGPAALWLHSCSLGRRRMKDVMQRTFIQAGSA